MSKAKILHLIQLIPILLVQTYTIRPKLLRRDQRNSSRLTLFAFRNVNSESDPIALSKISSRPRNFYRSDDAPFALETSLLYQKKNTTLYRRKQFIEGLATCFVTISGLRPAWGTTMDPKTGIRLPDPGEIEASLPTNWASEENPIVATGAGTGSNFNSQFARLDEKPDSKFYEDPRFVEHVDDNAVAIIKDYVSQIAIQPGRDTAVLDLCSSWTSHIDGNIAAKMTRVAGLGMNAKELDRNEALTDWIVQDLNENPQLSKYEDESFDVVLCQLSIDYLTKPLQVLKDVGRILKVGGKVHIIFSNRLFLSKAVGLWTGGDDIDHAFYVGSYLHFCEGGFEDIKAKDLSNRKGGKQRITGDPVFVVSATKGKMQRS